MGSDQNQQELDAPLESEGAPDASRSCATASAIELPPVGGTTTFQVDLGGANADLIGSCGGGSRERVLRLDPDVDARLLVTFGSGGAFQPALYLRSGECDSSGSADEIACNASGFTAFLTASLKAGERVFVVADADGSTASGGGTLTLMRLP